LNVYFDNILDLESFNSIVVLKHLDEVLVIQQNKLVFSSTLSFASLFASSILLAFLIKQLIINSFDRLRNDKIDELNNDKLRKNTLANVNILYRRKRVFSLEKDSINRCRRSKIDRTNFEINNRSKIIDLRFNNSLQSNRQ